MKISKSKLTRELLESYVGKDVRITFFDGDVREGVLGLGNGFSMSLKSMWWAIFAFACPI